jgi:hypothetical protein
MNSFKKKKSSSDKPLNRSYSSYAPENILEMPYKELLDQNDVNTNDEAGRRNNLFEHVALLLGVTLDNICDESLEFLAEKAKVPVQKIITYIEQTERKQLGDQAKLTAFSRIKLADKNFSSQRSIRELCGLNMRLEESRRVLVQIKEQFTCSLSFEMFKDPVSCNSGHTFERKNIMELLQINNRCPKTGIIITFIFPNYSLRNLIDQFVENYKNQKGEHWDQVVKECLAYESYPNRVNDPIHINAPAPRVVPNTILDPRAWTSTFMGVELGDPRAWGAAVPTAGTSTLLGAAAPRAGTSTLLGAAVPTAGTSTLLGVGFGGAAPIERSTETLVPADAAFVGVGFGGAAPIERPQKKSYFERISHRLSRSRRRREERELEWRAELDRRIAAHRAAPVAPRPTRFYY